MEAWCRGSRSLAWVPTWARAASCGAWIVGLAAFGAGCAHADSARTKTATEVVPPSPAASVTPRGVASSGKVDDLSAQETGAPDPSPEVSASKVKTPKLRVIRLAPDGIAEARSGSEAASVTSVGALPPGALPVVSDDRIGTRIDVDEPSSKEVDPLRSSARDPEAKKAFGRAVARIKSKDYEGALDAFSAFIIKWPDHPSADLALFYRGESYMAKDDVPRALEQFEGVVARYPRSSKTPEAWLKVGVCHARLGNAEKADESFKELKKRFPRADAARRIPKKSTDGTYLEVHR